MRSGGEERYAARPADEEFTARLKAYEGRPAAVAGVGKDRVNEPMIRHWCEAINGLVGRYVTDHLGPAAVLRKVAIRLGAPNDPGDTMVLTGTVEEVDGDTATVKVVGANGIARHVTVTVSVSVSVTAPAGGAG